MAVPTVRVAGRRAYSAAKHARAGVAAGKALMLIRQADPARDLAGFRALWGEYLTWADEQFDQRYGFRMPVDDILERNLAELTPFQPPQGRLLLAGDGEDMMAVGCLQPLDPATAEIKRMFVRPQARGGGLGRAVLAALLDAARQEGYRQVRLDSSRFMHAAHALYRSVGFVEIDPYPQSEVPPELWQHWIFMQLDL